MSRYARAFFVGVILLLLVGSVAYGVYFWQHQRADDLERQVAQLNTKLDAASRKRVSVEAHHYVSHKGVGLWVYTPTAGSRLASPVVVMGEVPGNWSFEASFPIKLLDDKGNVVAETPAQLQGDWMTDSLVPFVARLSYSSNGGSGTLLLQKDNPSGIESNDDSVSIPVNL